MSNPNWLSKIEELQKAHAETGDTPTFLGALSKLKNEIRDEFLSLDTRIEKLIQANVDKQLYQFISPETAREYIQDYERRFGIGKSSYNDPYELVSIIFEGRWNIQKTDVYMSPAEHSGFALGGLPAHKVARWFKEIN